MTTKVTHIGRNRPVVAENIDLWILQAPLKFECIGRLPMSKLEEIDLQEVQKPLWEKTLQAEQLETKMANNNE